MIPHGLVVAALVSYSALVARPALAMQIFVDTPNDGAVTLDVEPSDTIENVKAKIQDKILVSTADQCLTFENTLLDDQRTLSDYDVRREERLSLFELPMWATWSITPDDPALGREVGNSINSNPEAMSFAVTQGSLPEGVLLNEATGVITGRFNAAGPFNATIGVTTICGVTDLTWSGSVPSNEPNTLPQTGEDTSRVFLVMATATLSALAGLILVAVRRRLRTM